MPLDFLFVVVGVLLLTGAGDILVALAVALSLRLRLSRALIGLTVVALGTSAPELFATLFATLEGQADLAVGNVVGSNTFNIALILGAAALIAPIPVSVGLFRLEYPFMVLATWGALLLFRDGQLDRLEGASLLVALGAFVSYTVYKAKRLGETPATVLAIPDRTRRLSRWPVWVLLLALGGAISVLAGGAALLIEGAANLAIELGISKRVVGIVIVGLGTSLPELATSLMAALRREHEIAVYNIVGSNIANLFLVLGLAAALRPLPVSAGILSVDVWVMMAAALVLFPLMWRQLDISRPEGGLLLSGAVTYIAYLIAFG
jgi:cation:H+ antiporter